MNNTAAIAVTTVAVAGVTVAAISRWNALIHDLEGRFPDLDTKIIRKAYRKFMINAFMQKYDLEHFSNEQMDELFMQEVTKITLKKYKNF